MNNRLLVIAAVVVGLLLLALTVVYWRIPANSLPAFIPGFDPGSTHIHFTHGVASLVLALGLFAFAWFQSGKKSAQQQ